MAVGYQDLNYIQYMRQNCYLQIVLSRGEAHNRAAIRDFILRNAGVEVGEDYELHFLNQRGEFCQINPGSNLSQAFASAREYLSCRQQMNSPLDFNNVCRPSLPYNNFYGRQQLVNLIVWPRRQLCPSKPNNIDKNEDDPTVKTELFDVQ